MIIAAPAFGQANPPIQNVRADAFDGDAWNGIVFLADYGRELASFALRFGSRSHESTFLDGSDVYAAVSEVGPHAPDGSYARMSWRNPPAETPVTLEWSRVDSTTVVGRLRAAPYVQLVVEAYLPPMGGAPEGFFSVQPSAGAIVGQRYFDGVFGSGLHFLAAIDRPVVSAGAYPSSDALRNGMRTSGRLDSADELVPKAAGLEFKTNASGSAHFVTGLAATEADLLTRARGLLSPGKIDALLEQRLNAYARVRPAVDGLFAGAPEAIGNTMFWNTLYAGPTNSLFPSISRAWAKGFGGWVVGEWDCFFGALLSSVEDRDQTHAAIRAILSAQSEAGVVPNVASASGTTPDRSQPPVGAYAVWKVYQRYKDRELLGWAYPRLKKWHEWWLRDRGDGQPWRDGNRDGLLEWGSDRGHTASLGGRGSIRQAKWESGMDDSPMYDDVVFDTARYTMNLNDVGLSSLYALDAECLSKLAAELGLEDDRKHFAAEYETVKRRVQANLWNDHDGIYQNRFWDGKFSPRLSPTNFYPLLAGIATPDQARRMVREHLLNPREFWGPYAVPTIARNDPAFADQHYWRGNIWGPTNYLVYQGLNRYGFDDEAFELAEKSYRLFMSDWEARAQSGENYHTWGGNGGGDTHYTWGALLCLMALEQYIDANPWDGLRFGALKPPAQGRFRGAVWDNHRFDVAIGPHRTTLTRDGKLVFEADGAVVVRQYQPSRFTIKSQSPIHLAVTSDSGAVRLKLPAGTHEVQLVRQSAR
jgi:hypothetical protein